MVLSRIETVVGDRAAVRLDHGCMDRKCTLDLVYMTTIIHIPIINARYHSV